MTQQPEALRLADELLALHGPTDIDERAAAELRRQHDRITELEAALRQAVEVMEQMWGLGYRTLGDKHKEAITTAEQALEGKV